MTAVSRREVLPRDAIPSIDEPVFADAHHGTPSDEAVVLDGDPPRAYPIRILGSHEVVNDVVEGRPIAVTWCPICGSAAVYDRRVDGRTLTFGVSGVLVDDALVLYDRETGTEWRQTTGEAIGGELAGADLALLPHTIERIGPFLATNPTAEVLQPERGPADAAFALERFYPADQYRGYVTDDEFGLYAMRGEGERRTWDRTDLDPKTPVLGVERDGAAVGYPRPVVESAGGVLHDDVGGLSVVVTLAANVETPEDGRLYAYEDPGFPLELHEGALRGDGTTWDPATGESDDGRRLQRVPARHLYAFAWQDAHGPTAFYA